MATEKKDISELKDSELSEEQLKKRIANRKKREKSKQKTSQNTPAKAEVQPKKTTVKKIQVAANPTIRALEGLLQYVKQGESEELNRSQAGLYKNRSGVIRALAGYIEYEPNAFVSLTASEYSAIGDVSSKASDIDGILSNIQFKLGRLLKRGDVTDPEVQKESQDLMRLQVEFLTALKDVNDSLDKMKEKAFEHNVETRRMKQTREKQKRYEDADASETDSEGGAENAAKKSTTKSTPAKKTA